MYKRYVTPKLLATTTVVHPLSRPLRYCYARKVAAVILIDDRLG